MRTMTRVAGPAVAAALLVSACGTVHYQPGHGSGQSATAPADTTGAHAVTRQQAQQLARGLLARTRLPAAAHRLAGHPPQALSAPFDTAAGMPTTGTSALWNVPESADQVLSYVRAHPPAGMRSSGSGQSGTASQIVVQFVSYDLSRPPAGVSSASLSISVVPAGSALSVVRADVQVIWYPPRSAVELIPAGMHAITVSLSVLNPKPGTTTKTFTSAAIIGRLAAMLNTANAAPAGARGCPLLDRTFRLAFATSPGAAPYLVATAAGCGTVQIMAGGRPQPALVQPPSLLTELSALMHVTSAPHTSVMHPG
ncbi:MAG TPA: hypothetical protein VGL63_07250 [Streptosporangiaceae bacterium]